MRRGHEAHLAAMLALALVVVPGGIGAQPAPERVAPAVTAAVPGLAEALGGSATP